MLSRKAFLVVFLTHCHDYKASNQELWLLQLNESQWLMSSGPCRLLEDQKETTYK